MHVCTLPGHAWVTCVAPGLRVFNLNSGQFLTTPYCTCWLWGAAYQHAQCEGFPAPIHISSITSSCSSSV